MTGTAEAYQRAVDFVERSPALRHMDITVATAGSDFAKVTMRVAPHHLNGAGLCHGGFLLFLADSAAGIIINSGDRVWVSSALTATFLKPALVGELLTAHSSIRWDAGRSMRLFDVEIRDSAGDLVLVSQAQGVRTSRTRP